MIEFKDNEELGKYVEEHKIIKESIKCDFNISLNTDLIVKGNITAWNINADDINAYDIKADDIIYNTVCFAYNDIKCKSITGRKDNCKHFCLDGKIIIKEEVKNERY